jgi:hypothetical protein
MVADRDHLDMSLLTCAWRRSPGSGEIPAAWAKWTAMVGFASLVSSPPRDMFNLQHASPWRLDGQIPFCIPA